jgi:hypothetical protein
MGIVTWTSETVQSRGVDGVYLKEQVFDRPTSSDLGRMRTRDMTEIELKHINLAQTKNGEPLRRHKNEACLTSAIK